MTNLDTIVAVYSEGSGADPDRAAQEAAESDWATIEAVAERASSSSPTARWSKTATARR